MQKFEPLRSKKIKKSQMTFNFEMVSQEDQDQLNNKEKTLTRCNLTTPKDKTNENVLSVCGSAEIIT